MPFETHTDIMLNVVLVHPEIPPNTGNIGRLCCAVAARLHLIRPLGFQIDDKALKRAGLDYWKDVDLVVWKNLDEYLISADPQRVVLTSSKRGEVYYGLRYTPGDHILFGAETSGLPPNLFDCFPDRIARIPVNPSAVRSLNLSTAAGIIVYEALRQTGTLPR